MNESWARIFEVKKFDLTKDLHFVTADEIKAITGREPRILAKFDFSKDLPAVFKENGYFILPVRNGTYAIVRGTGFQRLRETEEIADYKSKIDFPLTTADRGQSEMQFVDNAYNTGVLEEVLGQGSLYQSIRGRERSHKFGFSVGKIELDVDGVQIEVDSGLEGRESVVLLEAKVGMPEDFNIRQLFYPYRKFKELSKKKTIPVFLAYDLKTKIYSLYVYEFTNDTDFNSLRLVEARSFRITSDDPIELTDIQPIAEVKYTEEIPQADKLDRIIEFVFKVSEGLTNSKLIAEYFQFDPRQSSYYRQAAEALGLVAMDKANVYSLTETGKEFVAHKSEDRILFITKVLAGFPLVKECLSEIEGGKTLSSRQIAEKVEKSSKLTGETINRRSLTLIAWLKWIAEHTGTFQVIENVFSKR